MFEELLEIADDGSNDWTIRTNKSGDEYEVANTEVVQRSRLRIDVRKWYLSKVLPKKFSDKSAVDITSGGQPIEAIIGMRITKDNGDPIQNA